MNGFTRLRMTVGVGVSVFGVGIALLTPSVAASVLQVGSISDQPAKEIRTFQPFVEHLASRLKTAGVELGVVVVASSIQEMATLLKEGKVDLYIDSPFPIIAVQKLAGVQPLVRRWKKGIAEYHSVVFVRSDSDIRDLVGLRGVTLAFEEPFSTSSYFLPKASLLSKGLSVSERGSAAAKSSSNGVSYVFSEDDGNTVAWVLRKKVVAGAMNNLDFDGLPDHSRDRLRILHETLAVPRHLVSYRRGGDPVLKQRIKEELLSMDQSAEGREVLRAFQKTAKFDELPPTFLQDWNELGRLVELVESEFTD